MWQYENIRTAFIGHNLSRPIDTLFAGSLFFQHLQFGAPNFTIVCLWMSVLADMCGATTRLLSARHEHGWCPRAACQRCTNDTHGRNIPAQHEPPHLRDMP